MKKNYNPKGFTLIELLVVIAIIGILAAIVYAPFQTAKKKGNDTKRISEMKTLQTSLALYADEHNGEYPMCLDVLSSEGNLPANANLSGDLTCSDVPAQDVTKYNYAYFTKNGVVIGYHLWTHLETLSPVLAGGAHCPVSSRTVVSCFPGTSAGGISESGINFDYDSTWTNDTCKDTTKCTFSLTSNIN